MRLLTLSFRSADKFLRHYSDQYEFGALFYRTKSEVEAGEEVLLEIAFPGLPNRALVRGVVLGPKEDGIWIAFHQADVSTRDFLLKIASGEIEITHGPRAHDRFPTDVPVSYKELATSAEMRHARAIDLAAASAFVRTDEPPGAGTKLELVLGPLGDEAETFTVHGEVTKVRNDDEYRGFAVHLDPQAADGPRLRRMLRTASEKGRVSL